jgi:hypothetical protein
MTVSHLLDTSVYSQPLRLSPLASVRARWNALGDDKLAISHACEAEVLYGLAVRRSARLTRQYRAILEGRLQSLPLDGQVARAFASLKAAGRAAGRSCSDFDFVIAATARVHSLVLATLNYRDFRWMQGLAVEDWSRMP